MRLNNWKIGYRFHHQIKFVLVMHRHGDIYLKGNIDFTTVINTWIAMCLLGSGTTILLGSLLNFKVQEIIIMAILAGAIIFLFFLFRSTRSTKGQ